jgi:hypothetical protein
MVHLTGQNPSLVQWASPNESICPLLVGSHALDPGRVLVHNLLVLLLQVQVCNGYRYRSVTVTGTQGVTVTGTQSVTVMGTQGVTVTGTQSVTVTGTSDRNCNGYQSS